MPERCRPSFQGAQWMCFPIHPADAHRKFAVADWKHYDPRLYGIATIGTEAGSRDRKMTFVQRHGKRGGRAPAPEARPDVENAPVTTFAVEMEDELLPAFADDLFRIVQE